MSGSARDRPELHFTAQHGYTNDPHGLLHVDGTYHMFFQQNPDGLNWSPRCCWGHAVSDDLTAWEELEVALRPGDGELGCWSGSAVVDERGPAILYTRIVAGNPNHGQVVLARPRRGMFDWARDPAHPIIDGPPGDLEIMAFRDPQLRRDGETWKAVLGGGLGGFGGCALQYSSPDLEHWTFDGVIARRSGDELAPVWTGKVWECPQLLRVGEEWVMLMSVWADHVPHYVAYAIGRYDGVATFTARSYGRFSHGRELYATTTFRDGEGRPCAMSWLRERDNTAPEGSPWCSAMSLPHVLSIAGDRLAVSQHPALGAVLDTTSDLGSAEAGRDLDAGVPGCIWRLRFRVDRYSSGGFVVDVAGADGHSFAVEATAATLTVTGPESAVWLTMPLPELDATDADIVVDADIIEITLTGAEGVASTRVPVIGRGRMRISAIEGSSIAVARLSRRSSPDRLPGRG